MSEIQVTFDGGQDFSVDFNGGVQDFDCNIDGILPGDYSGDYSVTPSSEPQTLPTAGRTLTFDVVVEAVPSNYGLVTWDGSTLTVS